MNNFMLVLGRLLGFLGLLISALSMGARMFGNFFVAGFQIGTLFQAGLGAMIAGCLCLLIVLTSRSRGNP
jgi:hypothetical protein